MADSEHLAFIHREIDGELDGEQRAELARWLLTDPGARVLHEHLKRLCGTLDALEQVEPPPQLRQNVLDALPQSTTAQERSWWSGPRWRYAAVILVALTAGTVLYETVHRPQPSTTEVVGTLASSAEATILDTVLLGGGPVSGRVSLYRDRAGLGLKLELAASAPVDVLIAGDGRSLRVKDVGRQDSPGQGKPAGALTVELPGFRMGGQKVDLTFLMDGREVGSATLQASGDR